MVLCPEHIVVPEVEDIVVGAVGGTLTTPLTAIFLGVAPVLVQVTLPLAGLDAKAAMRT